MFLPPNSGVRPECYNRGRAASCPDDHRRVADVQRLRRVELAAVGALYWRRTVWARWQYVPAYLRHVRLLRPGRWAGHCRHGELTKHPRCRDRDCFTATREDRSASRPARSQSPLV